MLIKIHVHETVQSRVINFFITLSLILGDMKLISRFDRYQEITAVCFICLRHTCIENIHAIKQILSAYIFMCESMQYDDNMTRLGPVL